MKTRLLTALLLGCLTTHCAAGRYRARSVTPEAAALLSRADAPGINSLVLDFEVMRQIGLIDPARENEHDLVDLAQYALTRAAGELADDPSGPAVARAAVLVGLLREWNAWPHVQRLAVLAPTPGKQSRLEDFANRSLLVVAVKGDQATNAELLQGLAAADRGGGKPLFTQQDGALCFSNEKLPVLLCQKAGPGYLAFSTPRGLEALSGPAEATPLPTAPGPLLRLRADLPGTGKGDVVLATLGDTDALRLSAVVQAAHPRAAAALEKALGEGLQKLDESRERSRAALEPVLTSTRQSVAADPQAPSGMKQAAERLTPDRLLDPTGRYTEVRQSIKVAREGAHVTAEVTFPESTVHELIRNSAVLTTAMVGGMLAAIALPNFVKFQCRARQSEAKSNLKGAFTAQKAYFAEHDRYGRTFEEIGFAPEPGTRYTYCMNGECLPCTAAGCRQIREQDNPCLLLLPNAARLGNQLAICAVGDIDNNHDPEDVDVWLIGDNGQPENRYNDCNN